MLWRVAVVKRLLVHIHNAENVFYACYLKLFSLFKDGILLTRVYGVDEEVVLGVWGIASDAHLIILLIKPNLFFVSLVQVIASKWLFFQTYIWSHHLDIFPLIVFIGNIFCDCLFALLWTKLPTVKFGGYSDEPGVPPSVRKHFRVRSIT